MGTCAEERSVSKRTGGHCGTKTHLSHKNTESSDIVLHKTHPFVSIFRNLRQNSAFTLQGNCFTFISSRAAPWKTTWENKFPLNQVWISIFLQFLDSVTQGFWQLSVFWWQNINCWRTETSPGMKLQWDGQRAKVLVLDLPGQNYLLSFFF